MARMERLEREALRIAVGIVKHVRKNCGGRTPGVSEVLEKFSTRADQFPGFLRATGILAVLSYYMYSAAKKQDIYKDTAAYMCNCRAGLPRDATAVSYALWLYGFFTFTSSLPVVQTFPFMARYKIFCSVPCDSYDLIEVLDELASMDPMKLSVVARLAEIYGEAAKVAARLAKVR